MCGWVQLPVVRERERFIEELIQQLGFGFIVPAQILSSSDIQQLKQHSKALTANGVCAPEEESWHGNIFLVPALSLW